MLLTAWSQPPLLEQQEHDFPLRAHRQYVLSLQWLSLRYQEPLHARHHDRHKHEQYCARLHA